jgi:hypothetical protein
VVRGSRRSRALWCRTSRRFRRPLRVVVVSYCTMSESRSPIHVYEVASLIDCVPTTSVPSHPKKHARTYLSRILVRLLSTLADPPLLAVAQHPRHLRLQQLIRNLRPIHGRQVAEQVEARANVRVGDFLVGRGNGDKVEYARDVGCKWCGCERRH